MTRTIVHLSDLHFGRVDLATLDPLCRSVTAAKPDLVAISGDLTQRARKREFEAARAFLDRLPHPQIVVPGNHDVPVYNRFVLPLSNYERYITADFEPSFENGEISVVGVNTARALSFKNGRISHGQIETVRSRFCAAPQSVCKVLVVHHPLDVPTTWVNVPSATRARTAFAKWIECGVDLILAGHEHRAHATNEPTRLRLGSHSAIIVQAGTATSTRVRGEANSFNLIHIAPEAITIERKTWVAGDFETTHSDSFQRDSPRFQILDPDPTVVDRNERAGTRYDPK